MKQGFENWTLSQWDDISSHQAAKIVAKLQAHSLVLTPFSDNHQAQIVAKLQASATSSSYHQFISARCWWLAITHTDCATLNSLPELRGKTISEEEFEKLKWRKTFEWLKICVNTESTDAEAKDANLYFALEEIDREEEVRKILWKDNPKFVEKNRKKEISSFFKCNPFEGKEEGEKRGLIYLEFLANWFLKRYDLRTAFEIIHKIHRSAVQSRSVDIFPKKSVVVALVLFVTFFLCYFHQGSQLKFWEDYAWIWQTDSWDLKVWYNVFPLLFFVAVESVCLILLAVWMIRFRSYYLWFKLLLPRLLGGIVVGYLPLLLSEEIWGFAWQVEPLEGVLIVGTAVLFSFYYLFTEIRNVVQNTITAIYRGLRIGVIGLAESFLVGIFAQDLLARPFVTGMGKIDDYEALNPVTGLLGGLIYPKVLLLYFPLALLIGIFVQIIWEEKPITHPI